MMTRQLISVRCLDEWNLMKPINVEKDETRLRVDVMVGGEDRSISNNNK